MSATNSLTTETTKNNTAGVPPAPPEAHQKAGVERTREERMLIANTIYAQLGAGRFAAMTGAKNLMALDAGLQFDLPRGLAHHGINKVRVVLDSSDTYTVSAFRIRGLDCTEIKTVGDVYADNLCAVFVAITGLDTHL